MPDKLYATREVAKIYGARPQTYAQYVGES